MQIGKNLKKKEGHLRQVYFGANTRCFSRFSLLFYTVNVNPATKMTISKKHFYVRRTSTRAINKKEIQVDIAKANLIPQYTSVENLYKTHPKSLPLGEKYTRGLPNPACIDRFESAKKLSEVQLLN